MSSTEPQIADGKALTLKRLFSRQTSVQIPIRAEKDLIWALLTNAAGYPKWNSTVISIEGTIALGETIRLTSKLAPTRVFKLKVREFTPGSRMVWGDAMGRRVYELRDEAKGTTVFSMTEKIGGPVFPLFARMIPSFDESFERFAADLKQAAET